MEENKNDSAVSEKTEEVKPKKQLGNYIIVIGLVFALLVGAVIGMNIAPNPTGAVINSSINISAPQEIGNKAIDYLNKNIVQPGTSVSLVSVKEMNGIYEVTTLYQGRQIPVYITKDGSFLFLNSPLNTSEEIPKEEETEAEPPKTDKPEAHSFIMSYCPYGLQFLKAYVPVIELLGDKADLELNFVHYAMHGKKEIDENTRMYCIQKEQEDKLTKYLRCFVGTDDYEKCIVESGIDKAKLESCINSTDEEFNITGLYNDKSTWSGGTYPQYPVDEALAAEYDVRGSPTFVINGQTVSVTRSAEAVKEAVCSAFINPPAECDQTLSTTTEAAGIGAIGSGSGSSSGGQC